MHPVWRTLLTISNIGMHPALTLKSGPSKLTNFIQVPHTVVLLSMKELALKSVRWFFQEVMVGNWSSDKIF